MFPRTSSFKEEVGGEDDLIIYAKIAGDGEIVRAHSEQRFEQILHASSKRMDGLGSRVWLLHEGRLRGDSAHGRLLWYVATSEAWLV